MDNETHPRATKFTISIPAELGKQLNQERVRLAAELRTRLSMNQVVARFLRLGLEADQD